jgi:hypothetical protein
MGDVAAIREPEPPANDSPALPMPAHFRSKRLKAAWQDLIESADPSLHTKEMRFTFEFAASLMAKFRAGVSMTATESKELKRLLVALGLAKDEDGGEGQGKKNKLSKYLR